MQQCLELMLMELLVIVSCNTREITHNYLYLALTEINCYHFLQFAQNSIADLARSCICNVAAANANFQCTSEMHHNHHAKSAWVEIFACVPFYFSSCHPYFRLCSHVIDLLLCIHLQRYSNRQPVQNAMATYWRISWTAKKLGLITIRVLQMKTLNIFWVNIFLETKT